MVTREENELLCRVTGDAPMGKMARQHYWLAATLSVRVRKGAAPVRVTLTGQNFVAFRGTDGKVGFLDEACPHRGASLALARVEDCSLRCLFHGWKISSAGEVLEVPNEPNSPKEFAKTVKVKHHPAREGAGLISVRPVKTPQSLMSSTKNPTAFVPRRCGPRRTDPASRV